MFIKSLENLVKKEIAIQEMATHSSILAWRVPGTEEPGGLLSMGLHRVGHDWSDLTAAVIQKHGGRLGLRSAFLSSQVRFSQSVQLLNHVRFCNPMDCSTPGFPVHHQLPELARSNSCPSSWWCRPTVSPSVVLFSSCLQSFPSSGSGGQSIGASASVLPTNIQDGSPLGWTGWISLQSKEDSSPTPVFKSINSSALSFLYVPTLTSIHDYWQNYSFD